MCISASEILPPRNPGLVHYFLVKRSAAFKIDFPFLSRSRRPSRPGGLCLFDNGKVVTHDEFICDNNENDEVILDGTVIMINRWAGEAGGMAAGWRL